MRCRKPASDEPKVGIVELLVKGVVLWKSGVNGVEGFFCGLICWLISKKSIHLQRFEKTLLLRGRVAKAD